MCHGVLDISIIVFSRPSPPFEIRIIIMLRPGTAHGWYFHAHADSCSTGSSCETLTDDDGAVQCVPFPYDPSTPKARRKNVKLSFFRIFAIIPNDRIEKNLQTHELQKKIEKRHGFNAESKHIADETRRYYSARQDSFETISSTRNSDKWKPIGTSESTTLSHRPMK